jgi:hypothetical protein
MFLCGKSLDFFHFLDFLISFVLINAKIKSYVHANQPMGRRRSPT